MITNLPLNLLQAVEKVVNSSVWMASVSAGIAGVMVTLTVRLGKMNFTVGVCVPGLWVTYAHARIHSSSYHSSSPLFPRPAAHNCEE